MQGRTYHVISREDLSWVVAGSELHDSARQCATLDAMCGELTEDAIGLIAGNSTVSLMHVAIVVSDAHVSSFYAWVSTYLPGLFPISQLIRVISVSELRATEKRQRPFDGRLRQAWVGVVLGECMARTKDVRVFAGMSLAAAQSATSLAMAKAHILGASADEVNRLLRRISTLQSKYPASANELTVVSLAPVWRALSTHELALDGASKGSGRTDDLLSSACVDMSLNQRVSDSLLIEMARSFEPARDLLRFDLATAEDRIRIYDQMVAKLKDYQERHDSGLSAFVIGYAASRVASGGLKHVTLLSELGSIRSIATVWFSLCCFMTGRVAMAESMLNLVRLVDRELRYNFELLDVPKTDLGWDELFSLLSVEGDPSIIASLPKASPRSASIELAPGISIVVAVASRETPAALDSGTTTSHSAQEWTQAQRQTLDNALGELWKLREQLEPRKKQFESRTNLPPADAKKSIKRKKKAPDPESLF